MTYGFPNQDNVCPFEEPHQFEKHQKFPEIIGTVVLWMFIDIALDNIFNRPKP